MSLNQAPTGNEDSVAGGASAMEIAVPDQPPITDLNLATMPAPALSDGTQAHGNMVAEALGDRRAGETVMLRQVRTTLEATAFAPVRSHSAGNRLPLQPYETHMPQSSPPQTAPSIGYQVPPMALAPAGGNSMQAEGNLM